MARTVSNARANHPLIGTWVTAEEDSNVAFTFSLKNNKFGVTGLCRSDGEEFEITRVRWDGRALSFIARMPSTDTITKNVFRIRPDGTAELDLTTHEVWKKKDVKRGEVPDALRPCAGRVKPHTQVRRLRAPRSGRPGAAPAPTS